MGQQNVQEVFQALQQQQGQYNHGLEELGIIRPNALQMEEFLQRTQSLPVKPTYRYKAWLQRKIGGHDLAGILEQSKFSPLTLLGGLATIDLARLTEDQALAMQRQIIKQLTFPTDPSAPDSLDFTRAEIFETWKDARKASFQSLPAVEQLPAETFYVRRILVAVERAAMAFALRIQVKKQFRSLMDEKESPFPNTAASAASSGAKRARPANPSASSGTKEPKSYPRMSSVVARQLPERRSV